MSYQTGLSGLTAASQNLDVIGNNIANASTVGMKSSTAEFADLVASAIGSGSMANTPGIGTPVSNIAQNFSQGNVNITGNSTDVAINGDGFFQVTQSDGSTAYTRDGQFQLDKNGFLMTSSGANVMGYPTDNTGKVTNTTTQKLQLPTGAPIGANATSSIVATLNLNASTPTATTGTAATQFGTTVTAYDAQGDAVPVSLYFVKSALDTWNVYGSSAAATADLSTNPTAIAGGTAGTSMFQMVFNPDGTLNTTVTPATPTITLQSVNTNIQNNDAAGNPLLPGQFQATLDISKATEYGTSFAVSSLTQNGYTAGQFTGLSIDNKGVITTTYSNGQTLESGGMIALATFRNAQGLTPTGGGLFHETYKSGAALMGDPTIGNFGALQAGAVEQSNVDLTSELVNMMTAQRNYQANAQTIKTQGQIMQTLVNL